MSNISKTTLGELIEFQRGYDLPKSKFVKGEIPVISSNGVLGFHNEFKVRGPGITIGRSGTVGLPHYIEDNFFPHNTALFVKDFKGNHPKYIYYLLKTLGLDKRKSGSGVPTMNRNHLHPLAIFAHLDYRDQEKFADVLSNIDSKIDLNNRINSELEGMAKLLYDYWFVQFDFPDKKGKPYKSSGGKMIYNQDLNRKIPEGWEVKQLNQCIDLILDHRGKTPKKLGSDWTEDENGIIALSAKLVKGGKLVNLGKANKVDQELFDKWMPKKLIDGDILMTSEAPAGEFYFIQGKTDYCMSQRLFAIRADQSQLLPSYLYFELSRGHGYSQIMGSLSGSTVFGIRQDVLKTIKVVLPNIDVQKSFNRIVLPQLKQIKKLDQQNQQLTSLRDWLLPMLMNGQVTVKEAEEKVSNLAMVAEPATEYKTNQ